MAKNNNGHGSSFTIGFIVGGIIGALIALLVAPKKGAETRSDLMERSMVMRSRAEEFAAQARTQAQDRAAAGVSTARERVTPVVEQVSARINRQNATEDKDKATGDNQSQD